MKSKYQKVFFGSVLRFSLRDVLKRAHRAKAFIVSTPAAIQGDNNGCVLFH